ncbi:hypothetical protein DH2020_023849 [Rehmannia glutinosa]|uniref:Uncharacterized protein n=1 Tax=Rehmannia glutinosa TaxID=99300 RepID=A0ABR0W9R4_REHGL
MDEDRIALVLAKTSELRSKIINCIHKTSKGSESKGSEASPDAGNEEEEDNDEEKEEESLLIIKDALESLEGQLKLELEINLNSSFVFYWILMPVLFFLYLEKLLKELKEYKGEDLKVIHEAIAASLTEENNDLLLPLIQSGLLVQTTAHIFSSSRFSQNGGTVGGLKNHHESERNEALPGPCSPFKRVRVFIGAVAKTALTVVGVIAILSLAGFEPRLRKRDEKETTIECPHGKVPVIESGEIRCVVKERVEVPFESVVATPDVSYGCG